MIKDLNYFIKFLKYNNVKSYRRGTEMMELVTGLVIGLFVGTALGFLLSAILKSGDDNASN